MRTFSRLLIGLALCVTMTYPSAALAFGRSKPHLGGLSRTNSPRECAYTANAISNLAPFASLVHRSVIDCATVFDASPDWAGWTSPYFLHEGNLDLNWATWVRESPAADRRQLVISQPMIPSELSGEDWRAMGAAGDFNGYARQFAENLVSYGVGDAIIRLGWEMNGTWGNDNLGTTPREAAEWVATWRNIVTAMRSVPGAHFQFDWNVSNGTGDRPFSTYYPGNKYVDIVGDDIYDMGMRAIPGESRWTQAYDMPGGLGDLTSFASEQGKPVSIPEWGLDVPGTADLGGGDDPAFVTGLARFVAMHNVRFESYFDNHGAEQELAAGPASLRAYRAAFGDNGYALGPDDGTDALPHAARRG
jgi:hypothetical protein